MQLVKIVMTVLEKIAVVREVNNVIGRGRDLRAYGVACHAQVGDEVFMVWAIVPSTIVLPCSIALSVP